MDVNSMGLCIVCIGAVLSSSSTQSAPSSALPEFRVSRVEESKHQFTPGDCSRFRFPYLDDQLALRWSEAATRETTTAPSDETVETRNLTVCGHIVIDHPRVEQHSFGSEMELIGVAATGPVAWRRKLGFELGSSVVRQRLLGAHATGLVLSDLEVWSPVNGKTVAPASSAPGRLVARYHFTGPAVYRPESQDFLVFADAGLLGKLPGIYRLAANDDRATVFYPTPRSEAWGTPQVEDIDLAAQGEVVVLSKRLEARGPGWIAFTVLRSKTGETIFEEQLRRDRLYSRPRVLPRSDGHVVFWYSDETDSEAVAIHYLIRQKP
jgi:hypothetical protein